MKKRIVALAIASALLFAYGIKAEAPPKPAYELSATEIKTPVDVTPTPTSTPVSLNKESPVEPTPEPTHEPTPEYPASLVGNPIPEPVPELIDACYDEDIQTGEYHEDVPSADSGTYLGDWTITFYCTGSCCNGQYTGTASGAPLTPWHTAACTALPFGTVVYIEGVGQFVIEDTGVSGNWIDCCVDSHQQALDLGMRTASVYIVG